MLSAIHKLVWSKTISFSVLEIVLIFSIAFLVMLPISLTDINVFDEGFITTGANLVRLGQIPYRDFFSTYGPAQYYLIGTLYLIFGPNLFVSRIFHAFTLAWLVTIVYLLSVNAYSAPIRTTELYNVVRNRWISYVVTLVCTSIILTSSPYANYPALPATVFLLGAGFFYGKWHPNLAVQNLMISSCLVGIAGLFRWDFGIFGVLAIGTGTVFVFLIAKKTIMSEYRAITASILPAIAIMSVIYIPILILANPVRWYWEIIYFSLFEFSKYRGIEFLRPIYSELSSSFNAGSVILFYSAIFKLLFIMLPTVLPFATIISAGYAIRRNFIINQAVRPSMQSIFIALLCIMLLNQMRVRPSLWQGLPAAISALVLIPYLICDHNWKINLPNYPLYLLNISFRFIASAFLIALLIVGTTTGIENFLKCFSSVKVDLSIPRANSVRVSVGNQYYSSLIAFISSRTEKQELIYSGVKDHSKLFINDALIYFLSDRLPATRFIEMNPGVANTNSSQEEIIRSLEKSKVRLIVLFDVNSHEPNLSSVSNNIHILNTYISENYKAINTFGPYTVLERK